MLQGLLCSTRHLLPHYKAYCVARGIYCHTTRLTVFYHEAFTSPTTGIYCPLQMKSQARTSLQWRTEAGLGGPVPAGFMAPAGVMDLATAAEIVGPAACTFMACMNI